METMIFIGNSVRIEGTKSWGFVTDVYGQYCTVLWNKGNDGKKLKQPFREKIFAGKLQVIEHPETGYTDPVNEDIPVRPHRKSYYERERDLW